MAEIDRLEIQVEAQAAQANSQLDTLVKKLNIVSTSLGSINSNGLGNLASGIEKFAAASSQLSQVKTADFTRLVKNIGQLGNINASQVQTAASAMSTMASSIGGLGRVSASSSQVVDMAKSISKLGNANAQKAITNMPLLASGMKDLMQTLSQAPRVSNSVIALTNALANLTAQGAKAGNTGVTLNRGLNSYSTSTARATNNTKGLASAIGSFYAKCFLAIRAVKFLGSAVVSSMDFLETSNYFEVAMGSIGESAVETWDGKGYDSAQAYADSFAERAKQLTAKMTGYEVDSDGNATYTGERNLGMNPDDVMQYQAVFAQVSSSIGIAEESSLNFSKALTMLGADWSSLRNISLDSAWEKFASALAGQSRAVRSLGIDITNATLQEVAYKNGVTEAVSEMTQAEKAQLRLLAILEQSEVAYGDLANTIGSPANQIRILQQNFANLARTIGNLFLPIVQTVLPYVNALVIALQRLFQWIGGLLGIKFDSINSATGGLDEATEDLVGGTDDYSDSLDDANKAAEKLKTTVLGIDELNVSSPQTDSSSSSSDSAVSGGGMPELDAAIEDALAAYEAKWNEAFDRMENKTQELSDKIVACFQKIWDIAEPTRIAIKNLWDNGLALFGDFAWNTLGDFYKEFLVPIGEWMLSDSAGLPRLFNVLNNMLSEIDWGRLRESLSTLYGELSDLAIIAFDSLFDFVEYFLAPLGTWVMSSALPQLADIMSDFLANVDWEGINKNLEDFWKAIEPYAEQFGQGLIDFLNDASGIAAGAINILFGEGGVLDNLITILEDGDPKKARDWGYSLAQFAAGLSVAITAMKGLEAISGAIITLKSFLDIIPGFIIGLQFNPGAIGEIGLTIERLLQGTIFDTNTWEGLPKKIDDAIMSALNTIGETITSFFIYLVGSIFDWSNTIDLFSQAGAFFEEATKAFSEHDWLGLGKNILLGLLNGFASAIALFLEPIGNLFATICEGICVIFGIHSPSTEMEPLGENILLGIVQGFQGKIEEFSAAITEWFDEYVVPWFSIEKWYELVQGIIDGIALKWEEFKAWWSETALVTWWEENVAPWFTIEKWFELANGIKDGIANKWIETVTKWKTSITDWWKKDVRPWFALDTWLTLVTGMKDGIVTKWTETVTQWKTNIASWWKENVQPWFSVETWTSLGENMKSGIFNGFKAIVQKVVNVLNSAMNAVESFINNIFDSINGMIDMIAGGFESITNISLPRLGHISLGEISVPAFASGGIVNHPTLSMIGEAGAEAVVPLENNTEWISEVATRISEQNSQRSSEEIREQNELLRQQNELLQAILEKDSDITLNGRSLIEETDKARERLGWNFHAVSI